MTAYLKPFMAAFVSLTLVAAFLLGCRAVRQLGTKYFYMPSAELLRSLREKPHEDEDLREARVRQFTCWQIIFGFIGIGGAAGWLITLALHWLCEWSDGSAVWLLASCWCVSTIEAMCNGFLPHIKHWVEQDGQRQLLPSPGSTVAPVAAFTFTVSQLGADPAGKLLLLVACGLYHCSGALADFDAFLSNRAAGRYASAALSAARNPAAWLHSRPSYPADAASLSEEVKIVLYDGLAPYGRLGLGLGVALYAVLPLAWVVLGAIAIVSFSVVSRTLTGLPAACAATAIALGFYMSLTTSWEPVA